EGLRDFRDPRVLDLGTLRERGRAHAAGHPHALEARAAAVAPDDLAILVYTSGTTGKPKGAMHTHRGLVHTLRGLDRILGQDERDERMAFLPLCHIAERLGGE